MRARSASVLLFLGLASAVFPVDSQERDGDPDKTANTPIPSAFGALQPRVSHDGKRIACVYQGRLASIPAGGGELKILASGISPVTHPAWSPDDKTILFASGGAIRRIDAESGADLPFSKPVTGRGPFWFSKDGRKVLGRFLTNPPDTPVAWLDFATGGITPVAGVPENHASKLRGIYAPTPDGKTLVFVEHLDREGEQGSCAGPRASTGFSPIRSEKPSTPSPTEATPTTGSGASPSPIRSREQRS
jgi:Tol biopolymer transport system component